MKNSEKYKTAEGEVAFGKFCHKTEDCNNCPAHKQITNRYVATRCLFQWLDLEADEGEKQDEK